METRLFLAFYTSGSDLRFREGSSSLHFHVAAFRQYHHVETRPELVRRYRDPSTPVEPSAPGQLPALFHSVFSWEHLSNLFKVFLFSGVSVHPGLSPCCVESVY